MLHTDLKSDLALVTGATGGIGKATCTSLAALGCSIAVHYNAAVDGAKALVAQLEKMGVKAQAFQADLGDYDEVSMGEILALLDSKFPKIDKKPYQR